jgi:SPP1 gp7 family putative phage head morphogenesis protein
MVALAAILEALTASRIEDEMRDELGFIVEDSGNKAWRSIGARGSFNMQNPLVEVILSEAGVYAEGITSTLQERLATQLIEGMRQGEGVDQLKRRVRESWPDISRERAQTIARTETTRAQSAANDAAYEMSGVVDRLEWLAVFRNTRPSHSALHGVIVDVGEDFVSGAGNRARYPGGFGVPEEDVNCNCAVVPVIITDGLSQTEKQMLRIDSVADRRRYEVRFAEAMESVILSYLPDILARIR